MNTLDVKMNIYLLSEFLTRMITHLLTKIGYFRKTYELFFCFICVGLYQGSKRAARPNGPARPGPAWPGPIQLIEPNLLGPAGLIIEDRWAGRAKISVGPPDSKFDPDFSISIYRCHL